jgi:hypothetical protein
MNIPARRVNMVTMSKEELPAAYAFGGPKLNFGDNLKIAYKPATPIRDFIRALIAKAF